MKQVRLLILFFTGFLMGGTSFGQVVKSFTARPSMFTIHGDFTMIGNSNLTKVGQNTGGSSENNDFSPMGYIDVDNDNSTVNSSSSTITIPVENGMDPAKTNIVYAGLYWSGRAFSSNNSNVSSFTVTKDGTTYTLNENQVLLKGPNGNYQTIDAGSNIYYPTGDASLASNDYGMYVGYADVTNIVKANGNGIGEYTVGNIATSEGNANGIGFYGGWMMVVVYSNPKAFSRNISLFDGYAFVNNTGNQFTIPVDGFLANPNGSVIAKLGYFAGEGDLGSTGDFLSIKSQSTGNYVRLDHGTGTNNFFSSSIVGVPNRNPNNDNNYGVDLGMLDLPNTNNELITNNQTSTSFQYGTTSETYIIQFLAFSIETIQFNGLVVNDANGNNNGLVDGTVTQLPDGLYANIIDPSTGKVIGVIPVANGKFNLSSFANPGGAVNLTVQLSTQQGTVGSPLPSGVAPDGWVFVGTTDNGGAPDGNGTGRQNFTIQSNGDVTGLVLGLDAIPVATAKAFGQVANSAFTDDSQNGYLGIPLNSTSLAVPDGNYNGTGGSLSGSDLEDCASSNSCSTGTGTTYKINSILPNTRLFYNGTEITMANGPVTIPDFDASKMVLYGSDADISSPQTYGFNYSIVDKASVTSVGVDYTISPEKPLPIQLMNFNAIKAGDHVNISWSTASESNNAGFDIEHSTNGQNWASIGHLDSKGVNGNSAAQLNYEFVDLNPSEGVNYYRLAQDDFDGHSTLSEVKIVTFDGTSKISLYPNPVSTTAIVRGLDGSEVLRVFDADGRVVFNQRASGNQMDINFSSLSQGTYRVQVIATNGKLIKTISVIKAR